MQLIARDKIKRTCAGSSLRCYAQSRSIVVVILNLPTVLRGLLNKISHLFTRPWRRIRKKWNAGRIDHEFVVRTFLLGTFDQSDHLQHSTK
jgi:hypothetical protein